MKDRVVIVTGGSRGIGLATAGRFVELGATIVLADVDALAGERAAEDLRKVGPAVLFVPTNVASRDETDALARTVLEHFGRIDVLVNNAGITRDASLKKMSGEDFDRVIDVNLKGVFNCTKSVLAAMMDAGWGRVLNAASVVGLYGNFGQSNYVASKAGVIGLTRTWARELGRYGITVNAVAPGFIETPMLETVPGGVIDDLVARTPVGRLGRPEDIAEAYAFLASERASFITGAILSVDGGLVP